MYWFPLQLREEKQKEHQTQWEILEKLLPVSQSKMYFKLSKAKTEIVPMSMYCEISSQIL